MADSLKQYYCIVRFMYMKIFSHHKTMIVTVHTQLVFRSLQNGTAPGIFYIRNTDIKLGLTAILNEQTEFTETLIINSATNAVAKCKCL